MTAYGMPHSQKNRKEKKTGVGGGLDISANKSAKLTKVLRGLWDILSAYAWGMTHSAQMITRCQITTGFAATPISKEHRTIRAFWTHTFGIHKNNGCENSC